MFWVTWTIHCFTVHSQVAQDLIILRALPVWTLPYDWTNLVTLEAVHVIKSMISYGTACVQIFSSATSESFCCFILASTKITVFGKSRKISTTSWWALPSKTFVLTSTNSSPGFNWPLLAAGPSGRIDLITWRGRFSTSNPAETESPRPESTFSLMSSIA